MNRRDQIIIAAKALPSLPLSISRIMSIADKPDIALNELAELIKLDPGLTVNVLRLANSSYFNSSGSKLDNIQEALFLLGMSRVKQLIVSSELAFCLKTQAEGYGLDSGDLLRHSISVAIGAITLAKYLHIIAPEHTFTAGLLANIGKIVMAQFMSEELSCILELTKKMSFNAAEREVLGVDSAELGAIVLEHWGLPETIVTCVRWHLDPDSAPISDLCLDLVHLGHVLTSMIGFGLGVDGMRYTACKGSCQRLGLTPKALCHSMEDVVTSFALTESLFS